MKNLTILAYHKVNDSGSSALDVSTDNFNSQMKYLRTHDYNIISLDEAVDKMNKGKIPERKSAVITFDDGHKDNHVFAYQVLRKYGIPATIFLTVSFMEKENFLSWEEIKVMMKNGISFGSHTITHPRLTQICPDKAREELREAKHMIENEINCACPFFCYPYGNVNDKIKDIARECGYAAAVVTPPRCGIKEDMFCLKRLGIYRHTDMLQFKLKLWGIYSVLKGR
jgi:peptidoglycan/xylan/chitin deacetylase (PgdA/CDA1 family)